MYKHIKKYEIKFTDADAFDNLKPSSLLSFFEESACLSAEELGFGYEAVASQNLGFILANYYIELFRPIKLGEVVEIHTWPLAPKHLIFIRDFEIYCGGMKVGVATSRWCMIDTRTFAMMPVSVFFKPGYFENYNTERSILFSSWKIPAIDEGTLVTTKNVTFSYYDHYFHVNNTKYADFLMDAFTVEELENKYVSSLQITYVKQCRIGDNVKLFKKLDGDIYFVEGRVEDELRVQFKVKLNEV